MHDKNPDHPTSGLQGHPQAWLSLLTLGFPPFTHGPGSHVSPPSPSAPAPATPRLGCSPVPQSRTTSWPALGPPSSSGRCLMPPSCLALSPWHGGGTGPAPQLHPDSPKGALAPLTLTGPWYSAWQTGNAHGLAGFHLENVAVHLKIFKNII